MSPFMSKNIVHRLYVRLFACWRGKLTLFPCNTCFVWWDKCWMGQTIIVIKEFKNDGNWVGVWHSRWLLCVFRGLRLILVRSSGFCHSLLFSIKWVCISSSFQFNPQVTTRFCHHYPREELVLTLGILLIVPQKQIQENNIASDSFLFYNPQSSYLLQRAPTVEHARIKHGTLNEMLFDMYFKKIMGKLCSVPFVISSSPLSFFFVQASLNASCCFKFLPHIIFYDV